MTTIETLTLNEVASLEDDDHDFLTDGIESDPDLSKWRADLFDC